MGVTESKRKKEFSLMLDGFLLRRVTCISEDSCALHLGRHRARFCDRAAVFRLRNQQRPSPLLKARYVGLWIFMLPRQDLEKLSTTWGVKCVSSSLSQTPALIRKQRRVIQILRMQKTYLSRRFVINMKRAGPKVRKGCIRLYRAAETETRNDAVMYTCRQIFSWLALKQIY